MTTQESEKEENAETPSEGHITLDIPIEFHRRMQQLQKAWGMTNEIEVLRRLLFPSSASPIVP